MNKIGILGLGWLGKPLAKALQNKGFEVKGSTTTQAKKLQLKEEGFQAHHLLVDTDGISGEVEFFFNDLELLIINIPPKIATDDNASYFQKVQHIISVIHEHRIPKVIYVSTTSVFKDANNFPVYHEQSQPNATSPKALQLIEAEQSFLNSSHFSAVVVRFGGLVGNGRHPVFYMTGKNNLANSTAPVNLIHLEDCIRLISAIIHENKFSFIFHGVNAVETAKEDFYKASAITRSLEIPIFNNTESFGKKISAEFTLKKLNIQFLKDVL